MKAAASFCNTWATALMPASKAAVAGLISELIKDAPPMTEAAHVVPSVIAADLNNDGLRDVFLGSAAWFGAGPNRLFKNLGDGKFEEI